MRLRRSLLAVALCATAFGASAQFLSPDVNWKEIDTPTPPAFDAGRQINIEMPTTGSTLRFGVDPATITIGSDGVVRYVAMASNSTGAMNAMYEGIRCATGQVKVYARHNPGSGWTTVKDASWRSLYDGAQSKHSLNIALSGVCMQASPNQSVRHIVNDLRLPADRRFGAQP